MNLSEPVQILEEILKTRKRKNPSYTKSAFARDMGVSQPLLSLIFSRRRSLTTIQAKKAAILLKLPIVQERELIDATVVSSGKNPRVHERLEKAKLLRESNRYKNLDFDRFSALAKWYHMPILALATTKTFKKNPAWIAKRLGISIAEAADALERLVRLGLLVDNGKGGLKAAEDRVELTPKRSEAAVREHHTQMMNRAQETMHARTDDLSWMRREISSLSLAVDPDRMPEAKALVKRFKEELTQLLSEGNVREIYQFNVQLFPLTRSEP